MLANKKPSSIRAILRDRNLMELSGQDHKRVRDSLMSFLRPESLKQYVGKIDEEVRKHIELHWQDMEKVASRSREILAMLSRNDRGNVINTSKAAVHALYWSLCASSSVQDLLKEFVQEKKVKLEQHTATPPQDLITCLLSKHNEENERVVTDKEILHNIMLVMVAGHDTSSVLVTFMLCLLSKNPAVYEAVLQGTRSLFPASF
ncbi:cytochrome P450 716B2-like [Syzygium oleosum]|uniref:cytochrome P450 716B2-like n=1 Tax=Syzygium oleosum TaxID=219896 RepID=UPI0011D18E6E|nr:cytochrome P450 716B2-like [Syzygium oleosum]